MKLPKEIEKIIKELEKSGFEGYAVGGCVRDIIMNRTPKDFDITTNATPAEIQKVFKNSFLNNDFGTVTILTGSTKNNLKNVEITPYRTEKGYKDRRHPDEVTFSKDINEDLKRRDFTVNAMALHYSGELVDIYNGREDIKKKVIKAVGDPYQRFTEDALRMMRAIRFSTCLNFVLEEKTKQSIKENAHLLKEISAERVRDEFVKIVMCNKAYEGIELLRNTGLLQHFIPELLQGYGVNQAKHHIYDCYEHSIRSLKYAAEKNFNFYVRFAALLHDIGKPQSKRGEGEGATFYNHEMIGAKITGKVLKRLKFKKEDIQKIKKLVRYHLFYYNVGEVSEASVRKLLRNVGKEDINNLLQVRMADRIGSGVPKAEPYKLRHLRYLLEKVSLDPISVGMLNIKGNEVIKIMNVPPSPIIGNVLHILLSEVITDPKKNNKEYLVKRVEELKNIGENQINKLSKKSKEEINSFATKRDEMTKKKYWVS